MPRRGEATASFGLRLLGRVLIRGCEARYIRSDLDELYARDVARGIGRVRAHARYARNMFTSAVATSARLMAVHFSGSATAVTARLRDVAAALDPALRHYEPGTIADFTQTELRFCHFWERFLVAAAGIALVLALAGIYSVMSFTVAQRTREIGIRVTLGANPCRLVSAIFRRPLQQVGAGIAAGALILLLPIVAESDFLTLRIALLLLAYITIMTAVLMLAWIVPTRRALAIEPTEALRWE